MTLSREQPSTQPPTTPSQRRNRAQSFGVQAARFSIYAPFTVFLINLFTREFQKESYPGLVSILSINLLLIVLGFIFGFVALFSMRRFGQEGIFGRALSGVILNGIVLIAVGFSMAPLVSVVQVKQKLVGHWKMTQTPEMIAKNGDFDITFNQNGTFDMTRAIATQPPDLVHGDWVITSKKRIGLIIESQKIGLGTVLSVDENELILETDNGDEKYSRVK